jgi:hypothetical protein
MIKPDYTAARRVCQGGGQTFPKAKTGTENATNARQQRRVVHLIRSWQTFPKAKKSTENTTSAGEKRRIVHLIRSW